jgi:DNA-dependent RNA polymerase auxiliary subunit epsilon
VLTQAQYTELKQVVSDLKPCYDWVKALKIEDVKEFMGVYGTRCWKSLYSFEPSIMKKYLNTYSVRVQLEVVKQQGYAIQFIDNPSIQVQIEAVKQCGCAIVSIENPSSKVQLEAVKQDGYAIQFIKNPSPEVQLAAVKQNCHAIRYIDDLSPEVLEYLNNCNKD